MCAKKVEIDRRVCLNKLPTVLIAHLKRIVFDFDTFENKKINTRFEFPSRLNIAQYTKPLLDAKRLGKATPLPSTCCVPILPSLRSPASHSHALVAGRPATHT